MECRPKSGTVSTTSQKVADARWLWNEMGVVRGLGALGAALMISRMSVIALLLSIALIMCCIRSDLSSTVPTTNNPVGSAGVELA